MICLLRAETLRLATIRSYWLLAAGAIAPIAAGGRRHRRDQQLHPRRQRGQGYACSRRTRPDRRAAGRRTLGHQRIPAQDHYPAVLITPGRTPLLVAKLAVMGAAGLVLGLAATGTATAIALPLLAARHIPAGIGGSQAAAIIAGGGVATALAAALGVGVGAIIRNQVGAIVTVLALLYVAEPLLGFIPHAGAAVQRYGLGGLAAAATSTTGFPASAQLLGPGRRSSSSPPMRR
jgi:hypothetical protein